MVPWIKITHTTFDKPEVYQIADKLNINPGIAFEKLCRVWVWIDQHTVDGKVANLTKTLLDSVTSITGFCQAMLEVGWLERNGDIGYQLPHFDRHNGETAKKRDTNARDVANYRARKMAETASKEDVRSPTLPKGKKCKDRKLTSTLPPPDLDEDEDTLSSKEESVVDSQPTKPRFVKPTIEEVQAYVATRPKKIDPERFFDYHESIGWMRGRTPMKNWQAAVRTWEKNEGQGTMNGKKPNDTRPDCIKSVDFKFSED